MKKIFTFLAMSAFVVVFHSQAGAQSKGTVIYGKIISFEESFPLEGVGVFVKGTSNSTGTQADGTFSLTVSPSDKVLVISGNEYQTTEVAIAPNKTDYEIALQRKGSAQAGANDRAHSVTLIIADSR